MACRKAFFANDMSIVRQIKETISRTSQRALGLDGIRFQLEVALERLEKLDTMHASLSAVANQIGAISAEVDVLRARLEAIETKNRVTFSSDAPGPSQASENDHSAAPRPNQAETEVNGSTPEGTTLLVTHAELCGRHGTGALLLKLLRNEPSLTVFYSHDFFKIHDTEAPAFHIVHSGRLFQNGAKLVRSLLTDKTIRRILCVPFYKDDVQTALTAQACTGAPLALYIMDDQNIHVHEIPDDMLGRLIDRANICFAISPALCAAYEQKYQRRFWLAPPTADPDLFVPPDYHFTPNTPPRGLVVGNVWSSQILSRFRETVRLSGLQIDWCGNAGKPFVELDPVELSKEGIFLKSHLPEPSLIELARTADYAVIPGGTLDGTDTHEWLARASLPSRMVYLMATANLPLIVMGHIQTAAAQFVINLGLGTVCDYSADHFQKAVREVTDGTTSARVRARARSLSPAFSTRELSNWLWESMDKGKAVDERFEALIPRDNLLPSVT
jgi:hypothetical protein